MASKNKPSAEAASNSASSHAAGLIHAAILTKQEAAALLRVTTRYLERQIRAGRLRACKPTGKLGRILRRDLEASLAQGATMEAVPWTLTTPTGSPRREYHCPRHCATT